MLNILNTLINQPALFTAHAHILLDSQPQTQLFLNHHLKNGADTLIPKPVVVQTLMDILQLQLIPPDFFNYNSPNKDHPLQPIQPTKIATFKFSLKLAVDNQLVPQVLLRKKLLISKNLLINLFKVVVLIYYLISSRNITALVSARPHFSMLPNQ
jgi:hypothetical protein